LYSSKYKLFKITKRNFNYVKTQKKKCGDMSMNWSAWKKFKTQRKLIYEFTLTIIISEIKNIKKTNVF